MNREETLQLLTIIHSVFPDSVKPNDMTVAVWQSVLQEPYEMVSKALYQYLRIGHFAPKPADLAELMYQGSVPSMTAEAAWQEVRGAYMSLWSETDYRDAERAWRELPDLIRKICTAQDLIDWAFHVTSSEIKKYEKPRFMKAFEAVQVQETQKAIGTKSVDLLASESVKRLGHKDDE